MTTLQQDRETATGDGAELPDGSVLPEAPPYACEACGAGMQAGQDWCLDCGTAAPGRLGARPGWRAAFTVVGLTLLLLVGAVAASYAALTGDAERSAARPSTGSGNPVTAQTPGVAPTAPVSPGETGPGTAAPPAPPVAPPATSGNTITPPITPSVTPPPAAPGTSGTTSNTDDKDKGKDDDKSSGPSTSTADPNAIKISAASLYDPAKRAGAEFGPPKNAIDGTTRSVWDVTVPADNEPLGVGLVLDLGGLYALKTLTITTPTSGFDVELYGTKSTKLPPDILDTRWDHLIDRSNYLDGKSVNLKGKGGGKVRFLNLWFAEAADATDPRVAIGNVKVVGTK